MGASCSATDTRPSTESALSPVHRLETFPSLKGIFPQWDDATLRDVILKCDGEEDTAVDHLLTWGNQDSDEIPKGKGKGPCVLRRVGYDTFMLAHFVRHTTVESNVISLQAAAKFIAQAQAAKKAVMKRKVDRGCESELVVVPSVDQKTPDSISLGDKMESGLHLMNERLRFLNLRMVEMKDDGNCQFRAISYELFGTQRHHATVRATAVNHLRNNGDTFSFYVGEKKEWQMYLKSMSINRAWGDELTITAAAQAFDVNIYVVTTEKSNWLLHYSASSDDEEPTSGDVGENQKGGECVEGPEKIKAKTTKRVLFLLYISPIHYNVIAPPKLS
jgi:hypothetical protein